jgi:mono/diheme cytochrome c family protein
MSKKTFIVFAIVMVVLAAVIPWLVFRSDGDAANAEPVPANLKAGQSLFQTNCGTCHTLYAAGTDGNYGPDLDELLAPSGAPEGEAAKDTIKATEGRVLNAVENGVNSSTEAGRMPGGIVNEEQAQEVSAFVAATAGGG